MRKFLAALTMALAAGGTAKADIPIALVGPLTGANAAFGEQLKRGAEQAVADINAKGGVLGQKLVLTVADDACDPKQAVAVANQLASKDIAFVAGHFCSGSSIPASAIYNEAGILQISPASTAAALTEDAFKKGWTNVYRACGRDDQQGQVAGAYLVARFKDKPVAIIDDKSAYGKGIADETRKALNAAGVKEVIDESITAGDQDFTALVSKLKQAKVEAIFFGGYQKEAALIIRQAREQGLTAQLVSDSALPALEFWQIAGPAGEGTLFTFAPDWRKRPAAKAVVEAFEKQGAPPEGFTLQAYATIQIYAQAVEAAKSTKLADLVKVLHAETFDTVTGEIKFDQKGDITRAGFVVWQWHEGKYAEL
ncbi:branched chain amino acid ABC transporter substrate-binding protein [Aliidongia dinghuensis]|uniref:Branched chain amino acid ABC transporter substrate-binding protein n=1 Tax=Aliidongia dinghuensis TaxID=1867774 RepID=A0A8J3E5N7_9PROT|nr:branched-chain amino acid ABC transporter substrate-binding protein [Aliidongia dinghuensis]GGF37168.1 branched chain amino acid ABC transporter substrate-binding protein [Aliidongia dinghuensis]